MLYSSANHCVLVVIVPVLFFYLNPLRGATGTPVAGHIMHVCLIY